MRLFNIDKYYNKFVIIFRKIAETLRTKRINPKKVFENFDMNKDGSISNAEFTLSLEQLGVPIVKDDHHLLFNFLDLDKNGTIDYKEFCRMLKRHGVPIRTKEEELIHDIWEGIQKIDGNVEDFFHMICPDEKGLNFAQMKNEFEKFHIKFEDGQLAELFRMADLTEDHYIKKNEFILLFRKYNKRYVQ